MVATGYEGAIARKATAPYQYGYNSYHSSNLSKFKPLYDSEFMVVGYTVGTVGKDQGALVWICEVGAENVKIPTDRQFRVVPKNMTLADRHSVAVCLGTLVPNHIGDMVPRFVRDFYGQMLTVEYPERSSKTGKPIQAKALTFRVYENGTARGDNPMARLYRECVISDQSVVQVL
jgi:hypothetical protein